VRVGEEIEAYCTSCATVNWHVVIALVDGKPAKVECLSCHKQRTLRVGVSRRQTQTPPAPKPPEIDVDAALRNASGHTRPYSPKDTYAVGDVIAHPTFGHGVVVAVPARQRMEVAFRAGRKMLACARDGAAPGPTPPPPPVYSERELPPRDDPDAEDEAEAACGHLTSAPTVSRR